MTRHKSSAGEKIKNFVILLLILSAVILGWVSRLFGNDPVNADSLAGLWESISGAPAEHSGEEKIQAAAKPVTIAVADGNYGNDGNDGSVGRYGAKYDLEELEDLYRQTFTIFSQALGSAQTPVATTESHWRDALKSLGIYYEYLTPVRLSILADWYGAAITKDWGTIAVRRLCVTYSGGENQLYFQNDADGRFYTAETAVLGDIAGLPGKFGRNSAIFAVELREDSAAPYTLLLPEVSEHPVFTVKNPLADNQTLADVLLNLRINENATPSRTEPDGVVYVVRDFVLRQKYDGTIIYHWTGDEDELAAVPTSESAAIAQAYKKVSETVGKYCGQDAAVWFDSAIALEDGGYQVLFRYVAAGGAVWLRPDGYAASVTVNNGIITNMTLRFRSFVASGEQVALLPEIQAEAAAGVDFMLGYNDGGSEQLTPSWIRLPLESQIGRAP